MRPEIQIGRLVRAKAGRDANRYFTVVQVVDEKYVYIADGSSRRLANPKLKKIKHLDVMPQLLEGIADKINNDQKVFDAELKKAINISAINAKEE